jgi:hypothetical protein
LDALGVEERGDGLELTEDGFVTLGVELGNGLKRSGREVGREELKAVEGKQAGIKSGEDGF